MSFWHMLGLTIFVQLTVIWLIAALLLSVARGRSSARHAIGVVSLLLVLVSPISGLLLPKAMLWSKHERPQASRREVVSSSTELQPRLRSTEQSVTAPPHSPVPGDGREPLAAAVQFEVPVARPRERLAVGTGPGVPALLNVTGCVWCAGIVVLASRLLISRRRLKWLWKSFRSASLPAGLLADVRKAVGKHPLPPIVISDVAPMPLVLGLFRPTVVLPDRLVMSASADRLRDVLIHECAHVARRDPWILLLQHVMGLLYWPHPGTHWLNSHIARAREEICDNYVLQRGHAAEYAQTLLEVAEAFQGVSLRSICWDHWLAAGP